jgi:hypothetical protein
METVDLSNARLCSENEIDNATYAVLCAAFCEDADKPLRRAVRVRLPLSPTPLELIDAICAELRLRGRLHFEEQRRLAASHVLAAFFDLPLAEREDVSLVATG